MSEFPQLRAFLETHVENAWRRHEVESAVFPFLTSMVKRGYEFRPLVEGDLEQLRPDLEKMLGVSVTEVRAISLDALLKRLPDESDEARTARINAEITTLEKQIVDVAEMLSGFEAWDKWKVKGDVADALSDAYDADLPEPACDDPMRQEVVLSMMFDYVAMQGVAFLAAAVNDDIVLQRFIPILRWFSRCLPVGGYIAEPGVFAVVTK